MSALLFLSENVREPVSGSLLCLCPLCSATARILSCPLMSPLSDGSAHLEDSLQSLFLGVG